MNEQAIIELKDLLSTPKNIIIIPHRNPDGDAMGSTLGLMQYLQKRNHKSVVMAPNESPDFLQWLPKAESVLVFDKNREKAIEALQKAELIFTLDFNALHRVGELEFELKKLKASFIMIDHHQAPDSYAKYTFSDTAYGSTCEMVYDFIEQLDGLAYIDKDIATCLYTGITTDSGSFRFPKTTSKTHRIIANLIDTGIDNSAIHNALFDNNTYQSLQLLGRALQNMKILAHRKTSYITLSQEELDSFHYKKGDTEGIVNYGLSIKGIIFTAIFIEHKEENIIKISLRSQGDFDVNELARTYFNGGGHKNAAGGKSLLSMEDTIAQFITIVENATALHS